ncbi:uncharacterized protein L969DRAFT_20209 [Mixia osmundae IAM 14324]|uniref:Hyaluronan/mRNA-binding protein domain-containing protein n=1 Tax=Mixia osmundae (strain CBS 9802 / IAM 14324 / JCM 22182 / KY 12970) TaxID=764103 RepID=G7DW25_MIXOS|nr:uncharacterized protein L969DRAFT_20209 [Mixia osmundae IAM 14324]KEI36469.1 hypothetical protein L969DRAFT_20209 [Mixia osmundae IAM 14324]GAA94831.1 hypothetical protein E5Q_01485 [Mixia osmundae IAM 14324]
MAGFSANRFSLLGDTDGDDVPTPSQSSVPAATSAPETKHKAGKTAGTTGTSAVGGAAKSAAEPRRIPGIGAKTPNAQSGKGPRRTAAEESGNAAGDSLDAKDERAASRAKSERGGRGRGGRGRGGRGKPFDRHSNTGITDSAKQEHQGWGGDDGKRELEAENAGALDAVNAADGANAQPNAEDHSQRETLIDQSNVADPKGPVSADAAPKVEEEVDNSKTYDEYLAEKAGKTLGFELPKARQANEGSDDSQWKDAKVAERKALIDDHEYFGAKEQKARQRKQKEGKTFLDVDLRHAPVDSGNRGGDRGRGARGGRGRGARGAPRGRGAENGTSSRGGRGGARSVNTEDATAFPSLGASS